VSPTPTRGVPAAVDLTPATFSDVKFIHERGEKGDEEDATLVFASGSITVNPRSGSGPPLASEAYKRLARATYVKARNPKWDPLLSGPQPALDLSGLFRRSQHWLVIQTRGTHIILKLDDSSWQQVLDTFETRTGLKVDRPQPSDK